MVQNVLKSANSRNCIEKVQIVENVPLKLIIIRKCERKKFKSMRKWAKACESNTDF